MYRHCRYILEVVSSTAYIETTVDIRLESVGGRAIHRCCCLLLCTNAVVLSSGLLVSVDY